MLVLKLKTVALFSCFLCMSAAAGNVYKVDDSPGLGRTFDGIGGISGGGWAWLLHICSVPVVNGAERASVPLYVITDHPGLGRIFDGIGGLDAGATSKLLPNYPEQQRNEILDYLFKPNFGASLHIFKVEICGDSQSGDGTEASHMHDPWDENYERGYEWWLLTEAKKRNPDIKLYGLPWAFPGWLGQGSGSPYTYPNITSTYILKWLQGAKRVYNLDIDYVGIWNERNYDTTYIKTLRAVLNANGFSHVKIVAADGGWNIAGDVLKDPEVAAAVDVLGAHYPGTFSSDDAMKTGKTLWASEDYSTFNDEIGGGCWARLLNWNYVNGHMTSTISWNLIAAYYHHLPFDRDGLMTAVEPWSGNYVVETPIWMSAHTTQFSEPGYKYLAHGSGVGHLAMGGTYVTLVDMDKKQLTIVIETMTHDHSVCIRPHLPAYNVTAQSATFQLGGSFSSITELNVWYSKLGFDGQPDKMFIKRDPIKVNDGSFSISLELDEIYTITTSTMGQKGEYPEPPPSKGFPSPYVDNFDKYKEFEEAYNFAPQVGSFEIRKSNMSQSGFVDRQTVIMQPIDWCENNVPIAIGGNYNWSNVEVITSFMIPSVNGSDGALVAARISGGGCGADKATGVYLSASIKTQKYVLALDPKMMNVVESKPLPLDIKPDTWYKLGLLVQMDRVEGHLNGQLLFQRDLRSPSKTGFVGYGSINFGYVDFQMISVAEKTSKFSNNIKYQHPHVVLKTGNEKHSNRIL